MAYINNSNNDTIINGTTSDDTIINYGSNATINAYAGSDRVSVISATNVTVNGDEGNDDIRVWNSSNIEVDAGADDDLVNLWSFSDIKVTMGSGNDTAELTGGSGATIITGDGDNYVSLINANNISIQTGNGTDIVFNNTSGFYNTIDSGDGTDAIENRSSNVIINSGTGSDTITNVAVATGVGGNNTSINGGADDDYIYNGTSPYQVNGGDNVTIDGGDGNDNILNFSGIYSFYTSSALSAVINGGNGNDSITNYGGSATIDGGDGNDTIENRGANVSINGGADNDSINLIYHTNATVNVSEGNDTVSVSNGSADFIVEGFGYGDVIQLTGTISTLTSIDGGIVARNATIRGISAIAQDSNTWTTLTNSITYQNISSSGASINGNTIVYSTVSSSSDEFTITGLSSTVGVSVSGTTVILDSTALDGVTGTVSISGDSYVLALNGVDTPGSTSGGWNTVGSNGIAVYTDAGTTSGWTLADDSKSITYSTGTADTLLALAGVATGASLTDISSDTVYLTADNFGSNGVTVTSNPNSYNFNLSGNFSGNSFTGTDDADTVINNGNNVSINVGEGNNSVQNGNFNDATPVESVTIVSGSGSDSIYNTGRNTFIDSGDGADSITSWAGDTLNTSGTTINAGAGDDIISSGGPSTTIDGGDGNDSIDSWGENESVNGGAGDDSIQNRYTYADVTMLGGAGNDSIYNNGGDRALIDGGDGSDSINNGGWDNSLQQNLGGHSSTIYGGAGDDHITNAGGNNVLIFSGEGNDEIHNGGWDGNTSMNMGSHYVTIDASTGNNDIFNRGNYVSIKTGTGNNTINNYEGTDITIEGGTGSDSVSNSGVRAFINLGSAADTVVNWAASSTINGGAGNDSIYNSGSDNSINGGAGNDSINLDGGSNTTVNVSDGNDTITVSSGVTDFVVESFGAGDVIQLATSPSTLTSIDGGIIAGNVTISGITSIAQTSGNSWTTSTNSITYHSGSSAGASLSGSTITYSTVSSGSDNFTITGLSSTVGVSVSGTTVILDSTALDGVTGTVSISGGDYVLALSDVSTATTVAAGWNTVGSDGVAVYTDAGTTSGWTLADDSKSITYSTGTADTLLALAGVATGASLTDISSDTVYLTADNFGSNGVTITSNPNSYSFNLSGDFNGNSFTGTDSADTITNYGDNISIDAGAGNDLISNAAPSGSAISANNSTLNGGDGNDSILSYQSSNVSILGGTGDDFLFNDDGGTNVSMSGGDGNDQINNDAANVTIDGGSGADNVINQAAEVSINVGDGNDSIFNSDDNVSINGGAGDDFINLYRGSAAFVDISDGNDTITVGSSVTDFVVEGFGYGDVIQLATSPDSLTTVDGGIIAGNVTISGITSIAQSSGETWTTSANSITYQSGQTAGASLSGSTITYSTVSSGGDNFTITGLSSTVGVSVSGTTVVLGSTALDGKSGTISISGGDYVLALSGVSTATTVAAGWDTVGDDEVAIYYDEGTTLGWILADDSKSVTYSDGNRDSLLALAGVKSGASLTGVSSDGSVDLTADNFGSNGVVVTSNPNDYSFNLSGDFDGNSFTGTVGNDTINNNGNEISINGSAGDDSINLVSGTGATVNVSDGNDTIGVGSSVTDFAIESFGEGDVIQLSETPASITTIDGGIVAGDVTITGVTSLAQDSRGWTTSANSITYQSGQTAGASLSGNIITYSTVSSSNDSFTITGLSSTVGVSVSGTQVILNSTALDGKSGTVSISGGDYTLALNGVDEATTIASGWDSVGDDEVATYHSGGATEGWLLSDDSKSVTYTEASDDNLLVLEGIRSGASLNDVSSDGTVNLTADNFGSDGVTVTSNPNDYSFNLSGDFEGNSFTGTEGADNINNSGTNILINGVGGNDSINTSGENSTVNGGADDDLITLGSGVAVAISYNEGDGNDTVYGYSESADLQINSSDGWSSVTSGNDVVFNVNENSSVTLVDAAGIIEPEIINEELPGRIVFSNWGYGFTPRDDSPLYGSPSLTEVSSADSSSGVNLQSNENLMSLSPQTDYIVAPSN